MRRPALIPLLVLAVGVPTGLTWRAAAAASSEAASTAAASRADNEARIRDADIVFFTARVAADPLGARDLQQLAALHLARGRATGSPTDLATAATLARTSLAHRRSRNDQARFVLANALMGEHEFEEALAQADTLVSETPTDPTRRSLQAELLMELGRYDEARAAFARVHSAVGNPSVAARRARWADLAGDPAGARRLLDAARREAFAQHALPIEQRAWFELRLAELALREGRFRDADAGFAAALRAAPNDPRAMLGHARLAAAEGDAATAAARAEAAMERTPSPEAFALLADAAAARGDQQSALGYLRALEVQTLAAPGAVHRPLALQLLAHGRAVAQLHARAEADLMRRRDIYGWDLAAAARLAIGDTAGAVAAADSAVALGTADAGLVARAGLIAFAAGDAETARARLTRAFRIAPSWDLRETPVARRALAALSR